MEVDLNPDFIDDLCDKYKVALCLVNQASSNEDIRGTGGIALPFLTSTLDGGEW
jgi:hypothetical protein